MNKAGFVRMARIPPITGEAVNAPAFPTIDAFRDDVRTWLQDNFPASLRGHAPLVSGHDHLQGSAEDHARWKLAAADKGWGAPTWPVAYGGAGLTNEQAEALNEELDRAGAFNPIAGLGLMMLGPTLLEYGNEEQKLRHLPPIARGELHWCQGFSEPGAGSDLASLRLRCEDAGDHWLLNGQKIWTSYAHLADWCFCIARTDTTRKHAGISFLLIDLRAQGIEVRPIKLINGISHFCETFFTDVKVPKENLVGEVNAGWTVAKRLLQFERSGLSKQRGGKAKTHDLVDLAGQYLAPDDTDLRGRLADHLLTDHAYRLALELRGAETEAGLVPGCPLSTLKNLGSDVGQERMELAIELTGYNSLGWADAPYTALELELTNHWLHSKCFSIYGGSREIQNNITARHELGLPTD